MKIYILFLFFFPLSAFAQHKNVQQFYLEFNGNEKSKTLSVSCETGACDLFLDSDSIGTVWAYVSTADKMISCLTAAGCYNTFLIQAHAGDGCPTVYQILKFSNEGKPILSEQFGNCNEFEEMSIEGNEIEFDFPGTKEPKRKKYTHKVEL